MLNFFVEFKNSTLICETDIFRVEPRRCLLGRNKTCTARKRILLLRLTNHLPDTDTQIKTNLSEKGLFRDPVEQNSTNVRSQLESEDGLR